jgi:predicted nucleic-acid-binding protein
LLLRLLLAQIALLRLSGLAGILLTGLRFSWHRCLQDRALQDNAGASDSFFACRRAESRCAMTASADALAEATSVLTAVYERDAAAIAAAVEMLLNHRNLTLEDDEVVSNAIQHFRRRPALGFSDCLMLEVARKAGHLPLGTFDRALARLPGVEAP